jgi:hypothetical protein
MELMNQRGPGPRSAVAGPAMSDSGPVQGPLPPPSEPNVLIQELLDQYQREPERVFED